MNFKEFLKECRLDEDDDVKGVVPESMYGPMGGDQRNMRGSSRQSEPDTDVWNGKYIEIDFPKWDRKEVLDRAKAHKVKLSPAKSAEKTVRIEGTKSDVKAFLVASGWNKSDLRNWYEL